VGKGALTDIAGPKAIVEPNLWGRLHMRSRTLLILIVIITGLELLAYFNPFPGIWWTHKEAMHYGRWALTAVVIFFLLMGRQD
jgi:hypothetical protein